MNFFVSVVALNEFFPHVLNTPETTPYERMDFDQPEKVENAGPGTGILFFPSQKQM